MKVLIAKDGTVTLDLCKAISLLNTICRTMEFDYCKKIVKSAPENTYIDFNEESALVARLLADVDKDYTIYITSRGYKDNYLSFSQKCHDSIILWMETLH